MELRIEELTPEEIDQISGAGEYSNAGGAIFGGGVGIGLSLAGADPVTSGVMGTMSGYAVAGLANDLSGGGGGGGGGT